MAKEMYTSKNQISLLAPTGALYIIIRPLFHFHSAQCIRAMSQLSPLNLYNIINENQGNSHILGSKQTPQILP